jgi:hypothetical protein
MHFRLLLAAVVAIALVPAAPARGATISRSCLTPPAAADGCGRWYTAPVQVLWSWNPDGAVVAGCSPEVFRVDTAHSGITRSCTVNFPTESATLTKRVTVHVDQTPPTVLAPATSRPPDYAGWFNHAVGLAFRGSDAASGIASCTSKTYVGPEGAPARVIGSCRDVAGHSATRSFPINYDTTPPRPPRVSVLPGNRSVTLSWKQSRSTVTVQVVRRRAGRQRLVFAGRRKAFKDRRLRNGRRYGYRVVAIDRAGNRATASLLTKPTSSKLLSPYKNAHVGRPPMLRWKRTRHARFYNVQLWRGGKKVLSRWPHGPGLQLHRRWGFGGKHRRLARGRYRWYVWPHGSRRYGKRLGASSFVVVR